MAATATIQLSSLSALSAVAASALNSILFSSGSILGFDGSWTLALRSSPVICIFAALDDLRHLAQTHHPDDAFCADLAYWFERRRRLDGGAPGEGNGPIATLRRNVALRTLSALLALSQTAKALATSNASWTKAACVAWLLSYAIEQITLLVAGRYPQQRTQDSKPGSSPEPAQSTIGPPWNSIAALALLTGTAALYSLVAFALLCVEIALPPSLLKTCICWVFFAVPFGPLFHLAYAVADGVCSPHFGIIGLAALLLSNCAFPAMSSWVGATAQEIVTPTSFLTFCPASALSAYVVRRVMRRSSTEDERERADPLPLWLMLQLWVVGMHFIAATTCYCLMYDPAGSVRPAWTAYLG